MSNTGVLSTFKPHTCTRCGVLHIVFKVNAPCPNCKLESSLNNHEHFKFTQALLVTMKKHKRKYGRYTPHVWFIENVSDSVSRVCFEVFDRLEKDKDGDHKLQIKKILDEMNWRKKGHLKIHVREIISELYKKYIQKKPQHTFFSRIKTLVTT